MGLALWHNELSHCLSLQGHVGNILTPGHSTSHPLTHLHLEKQRNSAQVLGPPLALWGLREFQASGWPDSALSIVVIWERIPANGRFVSLPLCHSSFQ